MKTLLIAFLSLTAANALASTKDVSGPKARAVFHAFAAALPELKSGFNHSESVMAEAVYCNSNEDEFYCTAKTLDGKELSLVSGEQPSQPVSAQLTAIWKAMERAHFPIVRYKRGRYISLKHLYCDHYLPGSGEESYECNFEEASDTE